LQGSMLKNKKHVKVVLTKV